MTTVVLRVDKVTVQTDLERAASEKLAGVVREAFIKPAQRLEGTLLERDPTVIEQVIERLELSAIGVDEALGPAGADRLAEQMFSRITREHRQ